MKHHWYTIKLEYRKGDKSLFSATYEVGLQYQSSILDYRLVKKLFHEQFVLNAHSRHLLCCGVVAMTPLAYLGRFRKTPSKADRVVNALDRVLDIAYLLTRCKR